MVSGNDCVAPQLSTNKGLTLFQLYYAFVVNGLLSNQMHKDWQDKAVSNSYYEDIYEATAGEANKYVKAMIAELNDV